MAFCLIVDRLAELNERLVESPHVAAIEVPLPDRDARGAASRRPPSRSTTWRAKAIFPPSSLPTCRTG